VNSPHTTAAVTPARPSLVEFGLDADERDRLLALRAATTEHAGLYIAILSALAEAKRSYRLQMRTSELRERLARGEGSPPQDDSTTAAAESAVTESEVAEPRVTDESLRQSLDQLRQWGCVDWVQDPSIRVASIEEYLKRHELWELTAVGTATLDAVTAVLGASDEAGALQRTMFRQIRSALDQLETTIEAGDAPGVYLQLRDLDLAIADLAANAREFYATINRIAREERLDDHVFVLYKDQLIVYLQSFHDDLVRHRTIVSDQLLRIDGSRRDEMLALAEEGDDSVGLFGDRADWAGRWNGMLDWFVTGRSERTEVETLGAATTVAIRELLTLLRRLTEQSTRPVNRASELRETAAWFARCDSDDEAHRLFDAAFGLAPTNHVGLEVDDPDAEGPFPSWWEIAPVDVPVTLREYGRRAARGAIGRRRDYGDAKRILALEQEQEAARQTAAAERLVTIDLATGPIDAAEWPVLLSWIDQALAARPADTSFVTSVRTPAAVIELSSADLDTELRGAEGLLLIRGCRLRIEAA
jgi:uncharacterized protein (TIGR02677 family)